MFSSEYCEVFKNIFLTEHRQTTTFEFSFLGKFLCLSTCGVCCQSVKKCFPNAYIRTTWSELTISLYQMIGQFMLLAFSVYGNSSYFFQSAYIFANTMNIFDSHNSFKYRCILKLIKVGLSPSKINCSACINKSPLK